MKKSYRFIIALFIIASTLSLISAGVCRNDRGDYYYCYKEYYTYDRYDHDFDDYYSYGNDCNNDNGYDQRYRDKYGNYIIETRSYRYYYDYGYYPRTYRRCYDSYDDPYYPDYYYNLYNSKQNLLPSKIYVV
ncbi:MAG: hypothetical protein Q8N99_06880 [Nanoarchaeota archaeon]|nr:hypothetical protein [Nanoarchaeota archaeon]